MVHGPLGFLFRQFFEGSYRFTVELRIYSTPQRLKAACATTTSELAPDFTAL